MATELAHVFVAGQSWFAPAPVMVIMTARFDRLLPGLEEIARVERDWRGLEFDAQRVARKQVNWLSIGNNQRASADSERMVAEMSEELAERFALRPDQTYGTAQARAEAVRLILAREEPDWEAVTGLLQGAYESLRSTLERASARPD